MTCQIELHPAAIHALKRIDARDLDRIRGAIALLGEEPRPPGARAPQGQPGVRVRVGDCRIFYTLDDNILVVAVITRGHRRNVYEHQVSTD